MEVVESKKITTKFGNKVKFCTSGGCITPRKNVEQDSRHSALLYEYSAGTLSVYHRLSVCMILIYMLYDLFIR